MLPPITKPWEGLGNAMSQDPRVIINREPMTRAQWGIEPPEGRDSLTLGEFSHLVMRAFGIPGGIMYTFVPGPRYAARELGYREFILDKPWPDRSLSGEEALSILGEALAWKEGR